MKRFMFFLGALFLSYTTVTAMPSPTQEFYCNDFAEVLSTDEKDFINAGGEKINREGKGELVLVTVASLDGQTVEEYANKLFRLYNIGDKEKNNGILILFARDDRKIRIEIGYDYEGQFTDAKCGRLLDDYAVPYLKQDQFALGLVTLYTEIGKQMGVRLDEPFLQESFMPLPSEPPAYLKKGFFLKDDAGILKDNSKWLEQNARKIYRTKNIRIFIETRESLNGTDMPKMEAEGGIGQSLFFGSSG